ncbi:D-alanyl-D-alanine carboxypeptidase family protein [Chlorobium phaeobacteroides]|nr:serine hydrolase [Chlorobium phaeobacteroides]
MITYISHGNSGSVRSRFGAFMNRKDRMFRKSVLFLFSMFLASGISMPVYAALPVDSLLQPLQPPEIGSYILKETGSSKVFMVKDSEKTIQPASLTKILTSIIALESGQLDDEVVITKEATMVEPSKAGFKPGERILLRDLVKAAMVSSSNDAAFAIGIHLEGSVPRFVRKMNRKARDIGMRHSVFTNPAGFDKRVYAGNVSTAEDLVKLTEYAIRNRKFNEIASLESVLVTERSSNKIYLLKTHNKLLGKYPYAVGIKTGFTRSAGKCLIARAKKENKDMLLVLLDAKGDRWSIAEQMFESAFTPPFQAYQ